MNSNSELGLTTSRGEKLLMIITYLFAIIYAIKVSLIDWELGFPFPFVGSLFIGLAWGSIFTLIVTLLKPKKDGIRTQVSDVKYIRKSIKIFLITTLAFSLFLPIIIGVNVSEIKYRCIGGDGGFGNSFKDRAVKYISCN